MFGISFKDRIIAILTGFVMWLARTVLSLRYDVTLKGCEQLRDLPPPVLVMPNHTTYVDPAIILSHLGRLIPLRPMVYSGSYRNPLVFPIMKLIGAIEVPDLSRFDIETMDHVLTILDQMKRTLQKGGRFLVYPSGKLQHTGAEEIGGTRAASVLLSTCPNTTVVLVRTTGLWGSMFGFAPTGTLPSLTKSLLWGGAILLFNLIFFAPRRKVTIEVEVKHASTFPGLSRNLLNPYLEAWYNAKNPTWEASPIYVPYHATFGPRTYHFPPPEKTTVIIEQEIDPEIQTAVNRIIEKHIHRPLSDSENTPNCLLESLGMDSLDRMEITILVELKFPTATELELVPTRIGELWALAQGAKVSVLEGSGLVATPSEAEGRC